MAVWPSVRYFNDSMDLNDFVLMTKVRLAEREHSSFVNGLSFLKSVQHKKMKMQISNPKILLLRGQTDSLPDAKLAFMDSILRHEDSSSIVVKKVTDLGANLVLVEQGMNLNTIRDLAAYNVTCFTRVNPRLMNLVARLTGAKPIELMGHMPYKADILGTCLEFSAMPIGEVQMATLKSDRQHPQAASVILTGPDLVELTKVKRALRNALRAYRAALLESSFFLQGHFDPGPNFPFLQKSCLEVHRTTIKDWKCSRPQLIQVQLYSKTDLPLGAFIMQVAKEAYEQCQDSEHLCHEHGVYFIHEQGLVQMFANAKEHRHIDQKEDVTLLRICTKCGTVRNGKVMLSNRSWEYSFFHFLSNFYYDNSKARCGHFFFRDSVFTFNVRSLSIDFQYVPWPTYSLRGCVLTQLQNSEMLKLAFEEMREAVSGVMSAMKSHVEDMKDLLWCESRLDEEMWQPIRTQLYSFIERLSEMQVLMQNTKLEGFTNHLEVETLRRSLKNTLSELYEEVRSCDLHMRGLTLKQRHLTLPRSRGSVVELGHDEIAKSLHIESRFEEPPVPPSSTGETSIRLLDQLQPHVDFSRLNRGNLHLPLGSFNLCIPVETDDPLSIIAYSLQTTTYAEAVKQFLTPESTTDQEMDLEMLYGSGKALTVRLSEEEDQSRIKVKVFCAKQFQALRLAEGLTHLNFLLSISRRADQVATQLGKSRSTFYYSFDRKFILKAVSHRELHMFEDMAPNYFRHMAKHKFHSMPSQLIKTLGAFSVIIKEGNNRSKAYYLLAANLEAIMPPQSKIFDLKGTLNARRYVKDGDTRTKMDINFSQEFHSLPLCVRLEEKQQLDAGLWNDTLFLAKQNVIDYSLLVIVNEDEGVIGTGIIDYMQHYTVEKAVESTYKTVVGRELPTITDPFIYKTRFRDQIMFEYFIGVTN